MDEENKITEAEVEAVKDKKMEAGMSEKAKKTDFYIELALFLILGVLIGIAAKTEANKRIVIGFNDFKLKIEAQQYNINKLQSEIISKQDNDPDNGDQDNDLVIGAMCVNQQ